MEHDPRAKYERFRHILAEPLDNHPSGQFPIIAGDRHFDLSQYQSESANHNVEMFDNLIKSHPDELFLDLGCGLRSKTYENCLYLEVYPSNSADLIVEPDCFYPIKDQSLMGVGCFAVLEHVPRPWVVVREMYRMLKPGGYVMIDWPFLQPVHGYPSHYFNATREGLKSIFADQGFQVQQAFTGAHQSAAYTVRWILQVLLVRLPEAERRRVGKMRVRDLISLDPHGEEWTHLLAALPEVAQSELACGNMLVAQKDGEPIEAGSPPPMLMADLEGMPGRAGRTLLDRLLGRP
ncbi:MULTISPECIES: methyltransferase domain-containing protein [unclassified Methylobacterium]|uniref:methyltransferase domain-containing protein n=1 Tax=unclassified Methylobacterium TaxID=2615210 RepID=UPI0011C1FAB9|nr:MULTISPECIES: methyltransferase domain-containing protein [unclassified Methylobacterium]QEE37897.1 class I SAM-dependent methyltransferase [Methylobacterium sp. WL1]TXN59397.1 class I SAM-dependent methyltransferase [Methylobacterium sp. WL2]